MQEFFTNKGEKPLVSYEQSFALATKLTKQYHDELVLADNENFGHANTRDFIKQIPEEIREKFYGHGITRVGKHYTNADKLAAFINILDNDSIKGDYGKLVGGQFGAWASADLLILSHYDTHLGIPKGTPGDGQGLIQNEIGWVANIGAYIVSNKYYPVLNELKKLYPGKNIIRADEISQYIDREVSNIA